MRFLATKLIAALMCAVALTAAAEVDEDVGAGPLFADFSLTLAPGRRMEAAGPLYYSQQSESESQWALPPFYCYTRTRDIDWTEWEFMYPLVTYRRFGHEKLLQILELINIAGGRTTPEEDAHRFTIFPLYFQQRARDTNLNYTAVVPFYGHLKKRLFRDDIKFILFPAYSETRKKDVVTDNYLFPIFDLRHGNGLKGWQFWPVVGAEHKVLTLETNHYGDILTNGGHERFFAVWPFYTKNASDLGTTNEERDFTIIPFYSQTRSASRDSTSYGWPFGFNAVEDREKGYVEHDFIWPLNVFAHGSKNVTRIFPFYSRASNTNLESDFYLWPAYKYNKLTLPDYERHRTRILFFLYSDIRETNLLTKTAFHRADFWPFYTYHRDANGDRRWQALALLEPFFPNNRSITREYSQIWSLWRYEKNHKTGATSRSLLWNLYRNDTARDSKKLSLFFGLFQYQSDADGRRWRLFYATVKKKAANVAAVEK